MTCVDPKCLCTARMSTPAIYESFREMGRCQRERPPRAGRDDVVRPARLQAT